jgi:uncharacterized protein YyaL (SSP411 family)
MNWLKQAVKNGKEGVSSHYSLLKGKWMNPFPETTGYIIPTFFDYYRFSDERYYYDRAVKLCDWLCEVQLDNGACMQGTYDENKGKNQPIIFNTGQNIFGFLRTYRETKNQKYLDAAIRAGDFLVKSSDKNGIWNRFLHHDIPHTYNSRTAWALLELFVRVDDEYYKKVAMANLDWVVERQNKNGWFEQANFKPGELPNTHGIAYTLRGLLEAFLLLNKNDYYHSARLTADKLLNVFENNKVLFTFWDNNWNNHGKYFPFFKGRYICLTGNIQLAIVWLKLFQETGEKNYLSGALRVLDFIKSVQNLKSKNPGIRGGIKGAFPISGSYSFLKYPNWAAKFFADALMMKMARDT